MSQSQITILEADLSRADHADAILRLLNGYAMDPMGDDRPLAERTRRELIPALREHPTTMIFLAWDAAEAIGLAICFRGFSTFAARPLINIHDFFVAADRRGTGIGRLLLAAVEKRAREIGCCKLTLEVQENNRRAQGVYAAAGFGRNVYVPEAGGSLFLSKTL
jgi:GNAT superfamily N-acetyltransferase